MKSSELFLPVKITIVLCELFAVARCTPLWNVFVNSGRPTDHRIETPSQPTFILTQNFQKLPNIIQGPPELKPHFGFSLQMNHPPRPPLRHSGIILQNGLINPPQPHTRTKLNESSNNYRNYLNPSPLPNNVEEKINKDSYRDEIYFEEERDTSTLASFTTDYTTETTTDYDTSTLDDGDLGLRIAVPDAVAASLIG